ncbi:MAG TPA: hypothetical protein VLV32_03835 [Burkholderiales bacterium]|nr:hypothetical protein [Burkholderiales bacterium]
MFEIIITLIAVAMSALYIGYLAYAIHSVPLWIIVIVVFGLMIREFIVEFRETPTEGPKSANRARKTD